jgi:hypothetical protein
MLCLIEEIMAEITPRNINTKAANHTTDDSS